MAAQTSVCSIGAGLADLYTELEKHPDVPHDLWLQRQSQEIAMALFVARGSTLQR